MATIWTSRTRARGQRGPARITGVNNASPFAANLLVAYAAAAPPVDLIHNNVITPVDLEPTEKGMAWSYDATGHIVIPYYEVTPTYSYFTQFNANSLTGGFKGVFGTSSGSVSDANLRFENARLDFHPNGGSVSSLSTGTWYTAAYAWKDLTHARAYLDGVRKTNNTPSSVGATLRTQDRIGGSFSTRYFDGYITQALSWTDFKSDEFMAAIHRYPWDWAQSTTRTYILPAAAAGDVVWKQPRKPGAFVP